MKNEKDAKKEEAGKGKAGEERRGDGKTPAFLWSRDSIVRRIR